MLENRDKWSSGLGLISKMRALDGCRTVIFPIAVEWWYDFSKFGCYLGNADSKKSPGNSRFGRAGGDQTLVANNNLHPSRKLFTPWANTIVPLAELALLKEGTL